MESVVGWVTFKTKVDNKSFKAQISMLQDDLERLTSAYNVYANMNRKLTAEEQQHFKQLGVDIEKTKNKIVDLTERQSKLNDTQTFNGISNSISGIISKVARWGFAVFGIRSAYMFVRQAIGTISQYNKNLALDIENIKYSLANALQPVIVKIVEWAYRLMQAINFVWRILTGHNLFNNIKKSVDDTNKSIKGTNKSAKELRKTLSGFDEMNILNDNVTSSGGGAGGVGGAGAVSGLDLTGTDLLSEEQKERLKKVADVLGVLWEKLQKIGDWFKDRMGLIYGAIGGLIGFNIGSKLAKLALSFATNKNQVEKLTKLLGAKGGKAGLIGALLVLDGVLITNIVKTVKDKLIPLIKETNERMDDTINMSKGVTLQQSKLNRAILENATAQDENTEATARNIDYLLRSVNSNNELNKQYSEQISLAGFLTGENKELNELRKENNIQTAANIDVLEELYKLDKMSAEQKKQYAKILQDEITKIEKQNLGYRKGSEEYKKNAERVDQLRQSLEKLPKVETTTINVKANTSTARKTLSELFTDLAKGGVLGAKYISNILKIGYAKGGIINMPGKGVPLPVGGERGQEGIVPLTDSQQMELLGSAIGKYISINATVPVYVGNRQIAREIRKIEAEDAFASNR